MLDHFTFHTYPRKVVFGSGTIDFVVQEVAALGGMRALVLSTPSQREHAERVKRRLGGLCAAIFDGAVMHTPVEVTERAMRLVEDQAVDCVVAIGGGSTTGLGKAIAWRTDLPQLVIPTTYAGSEMTPILGQTENGRKTTIRDPKILPETVIYDVDLTMGLPAGLSATSGMNAIAHAVEALYAQDRNPVVSLLAVDAIRALGAALPAILKSPGDRAARTRALYGAWLCGLSLGSVGMALHHKLCHTLGGSFDLPHSETHAVVLPHVAAFNAAAVPDLLAPVAEALGGRHPGQALFDLARKIGAPASLAEIGMPADGLDRAAAIATQNPYWNPREFTRENIRSLLEDAYQGRRPDA